MAIWQFEVMLIPIDDLIHCFGDIPGGLTLEQFRQFDRWIKVQPPDDYENYLSEILPIAPIGSPEYKKVWGYDRSDRIEVYLKDGRVSDVAIRIDFRKPSIRFLKKVVELASKWNCLIQPNYESANELIEPEVHTLLYALREHKKSSVKFAGEGIVHEPFPGRPEAPNQKVFISYSSKDRAFVDKLCQDLDGNNIIIWYDRIELKVGDSLTKRIQEAIDTSGWLIVVLSNNSINSPWVQIELSAGLTKELELKRVFVLPALIEDCNLPPFLRDKLYADFREAYQLGFYAIIKAISG